MEAHTCNPSTLGRLRLVDHLRSGVWDQSDQHGETPSLLKIQISWAWGRMPVIPTTWEAEAGELLESGRQRLQWAEITPVHSSLGNKSKTLSQKQKENKLWRPKFQGPWVENNPNSFGFLTVEATPCNSVAVKSQHSSFSSGAAHLWKKMVWGWNYASGSEEGRIAWGQEFKISLGNIARLHYKN